MENEYKPKWNPNPDEIKANSKVINGDELDTAYLVFSKKILKDVTSDENSGVNLYDIAQKNIAMVNNVTEDYNKKFADAALEITKLGVGEELSPKTIETLKLIEKDDLFHILNK